MTISSKAVITAIIFSVVSATTAVADYKINAIDEKGKIMKIEKNCSGNWARTNGAARRAERRAKEDGKTLFTQLQKVEDCPKVSVIKKRS
jgi:hypothetical protein